MRTRLLVLSALLALALSAPASAAPDRSGKVTETTAAFSWVGASATGYNTAREPEACSHDVDTYCDQTLVHLDLAPGTTGEIKVTTGQYTGPQCTPLDGQSAPCDFSLWLYASDATGKPGKVLGSSINDSGEDEEINYRKATPGYYLVIVYYYTVAQAGYTGMLALTKFTPPAPAAAAPAIPSAPLSAALAAGRLTRSALPVKVACSAACKGRLSLEISAATARKLKLGRKKLVVGRGILALGAEQAKLRLSPRFASRLRRARGVKATLRAALSDASGARLAAARAVSLRW